MTNYDEIDFSPLTALTGDEVVTHARVRDVRLASGKVIALITLDNGRDHTRPNTLGPATLLKLNNILNALTTHTTTNKIHNITIMPILFKNHRIG